MAAYAESSSSHPISLSLKKAYGQELDLSRVSDIEEIAGHGVCARVDGRKVYVGNMRLMQRENLTVTTEHKEGTVCYVAVDGTYAGCIVISDVVKPTTKDAIAGLKKNGIKKTIMLTGDANETAQRVAAEIGIDEVHSELLPADKVAQVEHILNAKGEKENLAFVGDCIHDVPVLSRADFGIAMGPMASVMKRSVRTLKIVRENIVFALAVKAVCLILGALGIANMWVAIFADVGVMVLAVLNATRALKIRS